MEFVTVARVGEIPPGKARQVVVPGCGPGCGPSSSNDRWVGLFNVNGTYHAVDNVCLHRGGPLADGVIAGCIVTCPWHGWQFDVTTGALVQDPSVGVSRHETRIVGDDVQVRLTD
jgi:nitrite reductase (NADH) small subunit